MQPPGAFLIPLFAGDHPQIAHRHGDAAPVVQLALERQTLLQQRPRLREPTLMEQRQSQIIQRIGDLPLIA